jgi:predicted phosphohydrolase
MDYFGPMWVGHAEKIASNWAAVVAPEDLVLIPGDISWALKLEDAVPDLLWIHGLPGTKVMIKGNHDYWWGSLNKVAKVLPPSIHLVQNNAFHWKDVAIGGARLWDTPEYSFSEYIEFQENPRARKKEEEAVQEQLAGALFDRELHRLELSLSQMRPDAKLRIAMTHYPPIGPKGLPSRASALLEKFRIDVCVFGHLHNLKAGFDLFGTHNGIRYILSACDYTRFQLVCLR